MKKFIYAIIVFAVSLFCGTVNAVGQEWKNLNSFINTGDNATMLGSGYYRLSGDIVIRNYIYPGDGKVAGSDGDAPQNVVIDLAGHSITVDPSRTDEESERVYIFLVHEGETLTIQDSEGGGVITGGKGERGGAIHVFGTLYFNGGTIKDCCSVFTSSDDATPKHKITNGCGGAIYIQETGKVYMSGNARIEGCSAPVTVYKYTSDKNEKYEIKSESKGGAVFVDAAGNKSGVFEMSGNAVISGCSAGSGGGVYLNSAYYDNALSSGAGASFKMGGNAKIMDCAATSKLDKSFVYTNYGLGGGGVNVSSTIVDGITLFAKATFVMEGNAEIQNNASGGHGGGVLVMGLFNMSSGLIDGNYPYQWNKTSNLMSLYFGGGVFTYGTGSCFNMTGGTVSGNTATSGGGLMAWTNSTVIIDGDCIISGNNAKGTGGYGNGGGLFANVATVKFKNGTFSGNYANRYGGAINIDRSSILTLEGDCIIVNNEAGHGGGLSQESGECNMNLGSPGITIRNNRAIGISSTEVGTVGEGSGGGVYIEHGTFTMSAGTIKENQASGNGGGVALRMALNDGSINVNINGGSILSNTADSNSDNNGSGGGLDIYGYPTASSTNDKTISGSIDVNLNGGLIGSNKAYFGGGVNIDANPANTTAQLKVGTASTSPDIRDNDAYNGGGISMKYGNVTVTNGYIANNNAENMGGGLYVQGVSERSSLNEVAFNGGVFKYNAADYGAGVAVDGSVKLTLSGTIEENNAINGGGIYLCNGSTMDYTGGLIRNNSAHVATQNQIASNTAYLKSASDVEGVGGGIFLDAGTSLSFSIPQGGELGIYGNLADMAADDIFANGSSTSIALPEVTSMQLKDFNVPTTQLFWAEDYIESDEKYSYGSCVNSNYAADGVMRYRAALADASKSIFKVPAGTDNTKYFCLALGYENIIVTITKSGLKKGESATFTFKKEGDTAVYARVVITGTDDNGAVVSRRIALTAGKWIVGETSWSWAYTADQQEIQREISEQSTDAEKIFEFTNTRKSSIPPADESNVVNIMLTE